MTGREPVPDELTLAREDLAAGLDGHRRLGIDDLIIGLRPVTVRSIDCLAHGQSGPRHSLISSLIHPGTPASIGVYDWPLSSQRDLRGRSSTVVLNTEQRKVDGCDCQILLAKVRRVCNC